MATENPVFQVLTTSTPGGTPATGQTLLGVGQRPDQLKGGQLGVFNYHTGLAIDGTVLADCTDFVIGLGVNRGSANNAADDIYFSSGQMIQRRHTKAITIKGYIDEAGQVSDITDFQVWCDTDYTIKIEIRSPQLYQLNGYSPNTKSFTVRTGCCSPDICDDCAVAGDCAKFVTDMIAQINADPDHLITASAVASQIATSVATGANATGNTTVTVGSKSYVVPVTSGDSAAVVAGKIKDFINADASGAYKASVPSGANINFIAGTPKAGDTGVASASASGSGVTMAAVTTGTKATTAPVTDTAAFQAAYPGACMGIRLTGNVKARTNAMVGSIPANFYSSGMSFIVSLPDDGRGGGFGLCNGKVTLITEAVFPEGKGLDVLWDEYVAGGWNGRPGPYRQSALTGLQKGFGFEYLASSGTNYHQVVLEYDQFSVGGWLEYLNNLQTIINIPTAETGTLNSLIAVLDAIYINTAFGLNADDATSVVAQPIVHKISDYTKDGIVTVG